MHQISVGHVKVGELTEGASTALLSAPDTEWVVVALPEFPVEHGQSFIQSEFGDVPPNMAHNNDQRLHQWCEYVGTSIDPIDRAFSSHHTELLAELAGEISELGYSWVYFIAYTDEPSVLIFVSFCKHLAGIVLE